MWQSECTSRVCDWELVPLSALSVLFPILFLNNLSNLFSVFQFLSLHNITARVIYLAHEGVWTRFVKVKCSVFPSGKTQYIFRILFVGSSSSASNTELLYKDISARWLIPFVVDVFTFLALLH